MKIRSLISCAALVALVSTPAFSEETDYSESTPLPPPELTQEVAPTTPTTEDEKFSFTGYWRAGYNTDINPFRAALGTHSASAPVSRHTKDPSYFQFNLGRTLENGVKVQLGFERGESQLMDLRELYLEMPVADDTSIWAGQRHQEFGDVRLLDVENPFSTKGLGIGGRMGALEASLLNATSTRAHPEGGGNRNVQDVTLLVGYGIDLGGNMEIKPMAKISLFGGAQNHEAPDAKPEIPGSMELTIGANFTRSSDNYWGYSTAFFKREPVNKTGKMQDHEDNTKFVDTKFESVIGLHDSSSFDFGVGGILTALYIENEMFHMKRPAFKVGSDKEALEADGEVESRLKLSIGVQPIYYVTDAVHLALDLNYAMATKKVNEDDVNAFLVTPIIRYTTSGKNTIGLPQIYTSFTFGSYDRKIHTGGNGKPTDTLFTTQTGFEVSF